MEYHILYRNRIQSLCRQRGISVNRLAAMSDIPQSTLDNIMRGVTKNPTIITIHKISVAFCMTISEFLDFQEMTAYTFPPRQPK